MSEKQIERISIEPAKNGGCTVRHNYRPKPTKRGGSMSGCVCMDYPEAEEFVFGADESDKMLAHVAKHLGLKKAAKEEGGE